MAASRADAALPVQCMWRGVQARRRFSELFLMHLSKRLALERLPDEPSSLVPAVALDHRGASGCFDPPNERPEAAESGHPVSDAVALSLEEAIAEAKAAQLRHTREPHRLPMERSCYLYQLKPSSPPRDHRAQLEGPRSENYRPNPRIFAEHVSGGNCSHRGHNRSASFHGYSSVNKMSQSLSRARSWYPGSTPWNAKGHVLWLPLIADAPFELRFAEEMVEEMNDEVLSELAEVLSRTTVGLPAPPCTDKRTSSCLEKGKQYCAYAHAAKDAQSPWNNCIPMVSVHA